MQPSPKPSKTFSPDLRKKLDALPPEQRAKVIKAAAVLFASKGKPKR